MPAKRLNRTFGRLKRVKKVTRDYSKYRRGMSISRNSTSVVFNSMGNHQIIPDKQYVKVSSAYTGTVTLSGGANFAAPFAVYGNSLYQPFNSAAAVTTTGGFTNTNGSVITQNPMGYNSYDNLYNSYKVKSSRIRVTLIPNVAVGTSGETVMCTVYPCDAASGTGSSTFNINANQRFAKWKPITSYQDQSQSTVDIYCKSSKVLGMTEKQYEDQAPIGFGASPAGNQDWYWMIVPSSPAGVTSQTFQIFITLDMYVELSEPDPQTS